MNFFKLGKKFSKKFMSNNKSPLFMDLTYLFVEDRLAFTIRSLYTQSRWSLTRRMTLALLNAWVEKLESVDLPPVYVKGLNNTPRNLKQEPALSLEFDGPQISNASLKSLDSSCLAKEVTLRVTNTDSTFTLKSENQFSEIQLTRKESHALLEMLAIKAKQVNWLCSPKLPNW